jgi:hypothetical protein
MRWISLTAAFIAASIVAGGVGAAMKRYDGLFWISLAWFFTTGVAAIWILVHI